MSANTEMMFLNQILILKFSDFYTDPWKQECEKIFLLTVAKKVFVVSMCLVLFHYKIEKIIS